MSKVYENDEIREATTEETRAVKTDIGGVTPPLEKAIQSDSVFSGEGTVDWRIIAAATEERRMSTGVFTIDITDKLKQFVAFAKVKPEALDYTGLAFFYLTANGNVVGWDTIKEFPADIEPPSNTATISARVVIGHPQLDSAYNETFDVALELYQNCKDVIIEER